MGSGLRGKPCNAVTTQPLTVVVNSSTNINGLLAPPAAWRGGECFCCCPQFQEWVLPLGVRGLNVLGFPQVGWTGSATSRTPSPAVVGMVLVVFLGHTISSDAGLEFMRSDFHMLDRPRSAPSIWELNRCCFCG
jgi:hypothetical protein